MPKRSTDEDKAATADKKAKLEDNNDGRHNELDCSPSFVRQLIMSESILGETGAN